MTYSQTYVQSGSSNRWHTTVEDALAWQRRLNLPADEFELVADSFFGNMDESCFMANADGKVKVIASSEKKKTEKITDDCRASITSVRCGMASGEEGPYIFLAKGKKLKGNPSKEISVRIRLSSYQSVLVSSCLPMPT